MLQPFIYLEYLVVLTTFQEFIKYHVVFRNAGLFTRVLMQFVFIEPRVLIWFYAPG